MQPENLPILSFIFLTLFFFLGVILPELAPAAFLFVLPLFSLEPVLHGGSSFSIAEISLLSWWAGGLLRKPFRMIVPVRKDISPGESADDLPHPKDPIIPLAIFTFLAVVITSALITTISTSCYFTPIFIPRLLETFTFIFSNTQQNADGTWRACLTIIEFVILFRIIKKHAFSWIKTRLLLWAIFFSAMVICAVGLLQFFSGWRLHSFWMGQGVLGARVNATLPDVNSCASYLGVTIYVTLALWYRRLKTASIWSIVFILLGLFLQIVVMVLTWSRIAIISFILTIPLFIMLSLANRNESTRIVRVIRKTGRVALILLTCTLLILTFSIKSIPKEKIDFHKKHERVNQVLKGRLNLWRGGVLMWRDAPWFGKGIGQFYRLYILHYDETATSWNPKRENAHNYFLQLLAETGTLGLLSFLFLIAGIFRASFHRLERVISDIRARRVSTALICALFIIIITSFTGHPLLVKELLYLFAVVCALAVRGFTAPENYQESPCAPSFERVSLFIILLALLVSVPFRLRDAAAAEKPDYYTLGLRVPEFDPSENKWFHWMGKRATIYMRYFPDRRIRFQVKNPLGAGLPLKADVTLGKIPWVQMELDNSEWQTFAFGALTPIRKYVRLDIEVDRTWQPHALNPDVVDRRRLGIMIRFPHYMGYPGLVQPEANDILIIGPAR
jgi:O-antigen ligase